MTMYSRSLAGVVAFVAVSLPAVALADGTMGFEGKRVTKAVAGERFSTISFGIASPRDATTGQATGRRQYKPVCVQRAPTASSATLMQNIATNEGFKLVTFDVTNGLRIKLTGASASSYQYIPEKDLEEICFVFTSIEVQMKGGPVFTDTWSMTNN